MTSFSGWSQREVGKCTLGCVGAGHGSDGAVADGYQHEIIGAAIGMERSAMPCAEHVLPLGLCP